MDYSSIKAHFKIKEEHGDKCKAICPAHQDKQASLSIKYDAAEKKTVVYCHAGCETIDVMAAVGLKVTDLFDLDLIKSDNHNNNIEAVYKYHDIEGNVLFEKVRFKGKKFSQRRYEGEAIIWGLDEGTYYETFEGSNNWSTKVRENVKCKEFSGIEPVIYNLPGVIKAVEDGQPIFLVEGEKDADNLIKLGLTATTNFDGASKGKQKWRATYNQYFKGANVVLLPDNDKPGMAHMEYIAKELQDIAKSLKLIELPELEEKQDTSDWLAKGHNKEELLELVKNSLEYQYNKVNLIDYNFSDVGNAERLMAMFGSDIRYSPIRCKWLVWSGKHWEVDTTGKIETLARKVLRKLQSEGMSLSDDTHSKFKEQIMKFVLRSESDNKVKAMVNQAKTQNKLILTETDKDIYLLNLSNGTLNLKTGEIQKHNRTDYMTKLVNIEYNPNAQCPNWLQFIDKIFLGRKDLIEYVQKSIGYSLTGDASLQCFYILHGKGSNGKGTFINTINLLLGNYAGILRPNSLMEKSSDEGARGDLAKLEGTRFVWVNELDENKFFDENLVKSLSSGASEAVPVRRMYEEEFDLHPTFKMWMTTNGLPKIKGSDDGIWRRVRKIPFDYRFTDEEKDRNFFEEKLTPEISGILNWAIEGCLKWQSEGMELPEIVKYAVEEYKTDMDPIQRFISDCCILSETCKVKIGDLYEAYTDWCHDNKEYVLSTIKLTKKLKEKDLKQIKVMNSRYWRGIGLVDYEHQDEIKECEDNSSPFWKQTKIGTGFND